ncbi:MAG TPA: hypothetical protein VKA19_02440 [Alphaproteobacteria bacterium]|nr:hypothetical protein [Alphaproteobacteria bacterium]
MADTEIAEKGRDWYGLTARQAELAARYVELANLKQAAREVGYDYREAKRLRNEHSQFRAAVNEHVRAMQADDIVQSRKVAREILEESNSDKTRLDAAKMLWERGAGKPVQPHEHKHEPEKQLSREELVVAIRELAADLGLTVADDAGMIDVTPAVPAPEPEPTARTSDDPGFVGTLRAPSEPDELATSADELPSSYDPPLPEELVQ